MLWLVPFYSEIRAVSASCILVSIFIITSGYLSPWSHITYKVFTESKEIGSQNQICCKNVELVRQMMVDWDFDPGLHVSTVLAITSSVITTSLRLKRPQRPTTGKAGKVERCSLNHKSHC